MKSNALYQGLSDGGPATPKPGLANWSHAATIRWARISHIELALVAFFLCATVEPARVVVDFRGADCKTALEWFAVTVTAAKWGILAKNCHRAGEGNG